MAFVWSMENIRKLAPDGMTMNRAMGIFFASKWQEIGGNEKMIWAKYPYYPGRYFMLSVQLSPLKYQCSCRNKATPCKHVLGLLVQLYRDSEAFFIASQTPDWVEKLINPSGSIIAPKKRIAPVSTKAAEERRMLMTSGVAILNKWLRQLIRQGLAEVKSKPLSYWDDFAAQLVDAKLGGVAKRVRLIKTFIADEDWAEKLLTLIGELHLFVKAFGKYDELPPSLTHDIDSYAGISPKRGEILETKGIADHWLVLGQVFGEEEKLAYRRTWLWGIKSGVPALNLSYSWGGQPYLHSFVQGGIYDAEIHFYPSAYPLRSVTKEVRILENANHHPKNGYITIQKFLLHFAEAKALNPLIQTFPVLLHQVVPVMENKNLILVDNKKTTITIICEETLKWQVLAFSGQEAITFFGEWKDGLLEPLGIWKGKRSFFITKSV